MAEAGRHGELNEALRKTLKERLDMNAQLRLQAITLSLANRRLLREIPLTLRKPTL